jgi:hypothetical protein
MSQQWRVCAEAHVQTLALVHAERVLIAADEQLRVAQRTHGDFDLREVVDADPWSLIWMQV